MTADFYLENSFLENNHNNSDNFKSYIMEKDIKSIDSFFGEIIWS